MTRRTRSKSPDTTNLNTTKKFRNTFIELNFNHEGELETNFIDNVVADIEKKAS